MPKFRRILIGCALLAGATGLASAQGYPTKTIRMVVPFAAGGNTDIIARIVAPEMGKLFGQQIIIDNRGGSGSVIGTEITAKSPPDGYTLITVSAAHVINPAMVKKLPYDSIKEFVVSSGFGMFAPAGTPRPIIDRVHDTLVKALGNPDVRNALAGQGADPVGSTLEEFAAFTRSEIDKWSCILLTLRALTPMREPL